MSTKKSLSSTAKNDPSTNLIIKSLGEAMRHRREARAMLSPKLADTGAELARVGTSTSSADEDLIKENQANLKKAKSITAKAFKEALDAIDQEEKTSKMKRLGM